MPAGETLRAFFIKSIFFQKPLRNAYVEKRIAPFLPLQRKMILQGVRHHGSLLLP